MYYDYFWINKLTGIRFRSSVSSSYSYDKSLKEGVQYSIVDYSISAAICSNEGKIFLPT